MSIIEQLKKVIDEAEAIVIGAGAGLSTSAGFEYGGKTFLDNFKYMNELYGYKDMYSAGFHFFDDEESKWGYWAKQIYINRYEEKEAKPLYKKFLELVKDKNYFVLTTNVDHQFQKAGFDKQRLFYTQGDYGLFQCHHCNKTYDNEDSVLKMVKETDEHTHKIPSSLIPRCPKCGRLLDMNLRCDDTFVEDEGWRAASSRYRNFLAKYKNKKILFLELGVGWNTPVIIKYPFIQMTYQNDEATYVTINKTDIYIPNEVLNQSISIQEDIDLVVLKLLKTTNI